MTKIAPSISSGVAGQLGVLHLPRLWQKASLSIAEKLHSDYAAVGGGFDQLVLDGLGIERDDFLSVLRSRRPTYPQLEAWILEQKGGKLESEIVNAINSAIGSYRHDEETREEILTEAGVEDGAGITDAITLNNLDDWAAFHRLL